MRLRFLDREESFLIAWARLMVIRFEVACGVTPGLEYQMEQLFFEYQWNLLKLRAMGRLRLKPIKELVP